MTKLVTFKATIDQVATMAALATNASYPPPGSPGWLQYDPEAIYEPKDFVEVIKADQHWINLDYVHGRCVKFTLWRGKRRNEWQCPAHEPRLRYQTWIDKFPTYPDLIRAAGIAYEAD